MNAWRILVVEDEPDGQEVVSDILAHFNIEADITDQAESALEYLAANDYNAIITDLALPGMDGMELLRHIKSDDRTAHLPCMAITAYHSSVVKQQAIANGFDAYLPKPLNDYMLIRELERILST